MNAVSHHSESFTGITLTPAAIAKTRRELAKEEQARGLRLGVKKSGCSGYMYVMSIATDIHDDDIVFHQAEGVDVVVDRNSLALIDGTVVDFVTEGLNQVFRFNNPRAQSQCGCGESFNVK